MEFDLQPVLENEYIKARPLKADDFEELYKAASDPRIWEQHPNPNRYKREVFQNFFKGAIESGGAFFVSDAKTVQTIGSSRFYKLNEHPNSVAIGYTFIARSHWGGIYNPFLKSLMINHAFRFVDNVYFHIGAENVRSQKAIERLGAVKEGEEDIAYYGEKPKLNFIYRIRRADWQTQNQ
ncbi:MAG: family N-acetyltransferase [Sphingobacteriaceae bacterium]|jgi:RimJ/RimL family protein N-acetyltransferase|nr:family N-acetyltransferase [Sphingobacteriaceae bacterium]